MYKSGRAASVGISATAWKSAVFNGEYEYKDNFRKEPPITTPTSMHAGEKKMREKCADGSDTERIRRAVR